MSVLEPLRQQIQRGVRGFVTGNDEPAVARYRPDQPGLFAPDSVTWLIHSDASMFIGGLRALLLQTLHPRVLRGVAEHSDYKRDPLGRLRRTASFIGTTTYASEREARRAIATVRRIHSHVKGTMPDGTPYEANDPHLLGWVHATEVDSFLRAFRRYGRSSISDLDADRYVTEMATIAELLGVDRAPKNRAELRRTLGGYRAELRVDATTRDAVRFLLWPPLPPQARPVYGVIAGASVSLLPPHARRLLWLPVPLGAEPFVVRPAATALIRTLDWALAS